MILQSAIPYDVTARALPGVQPMAPDSWLHVDEAYAAQMAERIGVLEQRERDVLRCAPSAEAATQELLDHVVTHLDQHQPAFTVAPDEIRTPDGRHVPLNRSRPFHTLAHLVQEDFCILQSRPGGHVLTAALLCFPASWRLDEKFMRPLDTIHEHVAEYDEALARRVQRLFDGVKPGRPLWRFNLLRYADPALYQPRSETAPRPALSENDGADAHFLRSERQCILRLPTSGAVVFSIHTYVIQVPGSGRTGTVG